MEFDEKDIDVIRLLTQLKNAEGGYPVEMMALRRQNFINQLSAMNAGMGIVNVFRQTKSGSGVSLPPAISTFLEVALVVAIVAEAAAVAFINREKINEFIRTFSNQPQVEEVQISTATVVPAAITDAASTATVDPTEWVTPTLTSTVTDTMTPSPDVLFLPDTSAESSSPVQIIATPKPNDNNGNQYGLTPKPERTKQPGSDTKPTKQPKH